MRSERTDTFFGWVWRFNALAIAVATVSVGGIVAYFAVGTLLDERRRAANIEAAQPPVAASDSGTSSETRTRRSFSASTFRPVPGHGVVTVPLAVSRTYEDRIVSKSKSTQIANLGFFDVTTRKLSWLLEGRDAILFESRPIVGERTTPRGERVVDAFLYLILENDADGDGFLTPRDGGRLAMSRPDGSGLTDLAKDVRGVTSMERLDASTLLVMFYDAEGSHLAQIDLSALALRDRFAVRVPAQP